MRINKPVGRSQGSYYSSNSGTSQISPNTVAVIVGLLAAVVLGVIFYSAVGLAFSVLYQLANVKPWHHREFWSHFWVNITGYAFFGFLAGIVMEWVRTKLGLKSALMDEVIKATGSPSTISKVGLGWFSITQAIVIAVVIGLAVSFLGLNLSGALLAGNVIEPGSALSVALVGAGGGGAAVGGLGLIGVVIAILLLLLLIGFVVSGLLWAVAPTVVAAMFSLGSSAAGRAIGKSVVRQGNAAVWLLIVGVSLTMITTASRSIH